MYNLDRQNLCLTRYDNSDGPDCISFTMLFLNRNQNKTVKHLSNVKNIAITALLVQITLIDCLNDNHNRTVEAARRIAQPKNKTVKRLSNDSCQKKI